MQPDRGNVLAWVACAGGLALAVAAVSGCGPADAGGGDAGGGPCADYCDPVQGSYCDIDTGRCAGPCTAEALGRSYVGCEYYPTVTGNEVNASFDFGVAVANTADQPAQVTVDWGGLTAPRRFEVAPGEVHVEPLPWVPELKGCMSYDTIECSGIQRPASALAARGAYRLRADRPVTVYQFNPIDYRRGDLYSYTNDASLLLPVTAMTESYLAVTWPYSPENSQSPSLLAVTATRDDTTITILPTADTEPSATVARLHAGQPASYRLHQGDVLELYTFAGDLSGTEILAEYPVQVLTGHFCTYVPTTMGYCDHLEESMFPLQTLATEYVVAAPVVPALPAGKVRYLRIVATQDDTRLTYDPPQAAAAYLARAGDVVEIADSGATFAIRGDKEILVAQFMEGETVGGGTGDPAMALAVPTAQYRTHYLFHAPPSYETSYADVVAPAGAAVRLDGAVLGGFQPVGASGFALARVALGAGVGGNHTLDADQPIGVSVYGYGQYTSYWYPGGLDLAEVYVP